MYYAPVYAIERHQTPPVRKNKLRRTDQDFQRIENHLRACLSKLEVGQSFVIPSNDASRFKIIWYTEFAHLKLRMHSVEDNIHQRRIFRLA